MGVLTSLPVVSTLPAPLSPADLPAGPIDGLYLHIPFCFHKCHYCDFYSITRQDAARMGRFVDLALREARLWNDRRATPVRPRTVFFGGGTPTLLPIHQMLRLITGLRQTFDLSAVDEFTTEANPATVTLEYCEMLRECGVDRISFGAQSFNRAELASLERHHDPDDVPRSIGIARAAGFSRLNVDLIYAIPGQDVPSWNRSLGAALSLDLEHYSCYGLTYEPNTPLAVRKRLGQVEPAQDELELEMMRLARGRMFDAGRPAYEISNYSRPGCECRHNLTYWTGGNYIGIGPSAASHACGVRFRNRPHLREWETAIEQAALPAIDVEHLTLPQRAGELAMLMLRLSRGLDFSDYAARLGLDAREVFSDTIDRLIAGGVIRHTSTGIVLSDRGLSVADAVAGEFLDPDAFQSTRT